MKDMEELCIGDFVGKSKVNYKTETERYQYKKSTQGNISVHFKRSQLVKLHKM